MCWTRPMRRGAKDRNCGKAALRQGNCGNCGKRTSGKYTERGGRGAPRLCVPLVWGMAERPHGRFTALQRGRGLAKEAAALGLRPAPRFSLQLGVRHLVERRP